ncbi:MAG TPA: PHP domain-containing protein [bacterium]|nr:PHP domain-containing protein [bacterium]
MPAGKLVDLHVHSAYSSDGQYPPAELVRLAEEKGLAALALTDHDEVAGLPEFMAAGESRPVETIPGVELTCDLGERWVHVLGYFIDWEAEAMRRALDELTEARRRQAVGRLANLRGLGIVVDEEKLAEEARGQPPVGPIIGRVVLHDPANDGHPLLAELRRPPRSTAPYFYFDRDLLSHGKPAYFPVRRMSPAEAVGVMRAAGGVAVFAHPGDRFRLPEDEPVFAELAAAGMAGIEAYCSYHNDEQGPEFEALARRLGLVATAGSDFHGPAVKPHVALGGVTHNPYALVDELRARRPAEAVK